jgi:hypothetical protein
MAKNSLAKQINEMNQRLAHLHIQWGAQLACDMLTIILADPDVMGKDTIGTARRKKIEAALCEVMDSHILAVTKNPEADYLREDIDRRLKQIMGKDFVPWLERYDCFEDNKNEFKRGKKL